MQNDQQEHATKLTGHYGLLCISGTGASKFLQGQLTCNVETLGTNAKLAAHCNPQGRIISLFYIFNQQDAYYLCLPLDMIATATVALKKYAVFFKVMIEDVTSVWHLIAYNTPGKISIDKEPPIANQSFNQWHTLMISQKIPAIYQTTSSQFLPHDLDLPTLGAIDFDKGCYTGQEIIARMHYRGKLKMRLFYSTIQTTTEPVIGTDVYQANNVCGKIVDYCNGDNIYHLLITADENKLTQLHLANHP